MWLILLLPQPEPDFQLNFYLRVQLESNLNLKFQVRPESDLNPKFSKTSGSVRVLVKKIGLSEPDLILLKISGSVES